MDNEDDFTFCRVASPVEKDGFESEQLTSDIGGITIKDEFSNGAGVSQSCDFPWKDKLPNNATFKKQEKIGSLSFNVIDASPPKKLSDSRRVASGEVGTSNKNSQEQKTAGRRPAPRAKVPFEKGHSQMDWLKLTQTHPDLAGLKGQSNKRLISMNEVKQHQTADSMWTVLKGRVYNLSPYMKFHPGGVDMLLKAVGKDTTSLFNKYHAWVNAEFLLEKCLVGVLDDSK